MLFSYSKAFIMKQQNREMFGFTNSDSTWLLNWIESEHDEMVKLSRYVKVQRGSLEKKLNLQTIEIQ